MINIISNKGFNEDELISFSKKVKFKLPNEYIKFLKQHNGGYVKDSIGIYHNNGKQRFILTSMFGLGTDDNLFEQFEMYKNRIPNTTIPIGRDVGGNLVCLNLSGTDYGKVYFWEHEIEGKYDHETMTVHDLYFIAENFDTFLHSIMKDDIRNLENMGYQAKKVWIEPGFLKDLENNSNE